MKFFSKLSPWWKLCVIFFSGFVTPALIIAFFVGKYYFEKKFHPPPPRQPATAEDKIYWDEPLRFDFKDLKPSQRRDVAAAWISAHKNLTNRAYLNARQDLRELYAILPAGYKDSQRVYDNVTEALQNLELHDKAGNQ